MCGDAGKVVAGVLLIGLGYTDCTQPTVAIALLVLAVSVAGFQYSGFLVNHVDIAPQYSGILFGISNSIAAVTGFVSPVVVGIITEEVCACVWVCVCVCVCVCVRVRLWCVCITYNEYL